MLSRRIKLVLTLLLLICVISGPGHTVLAEIVRSSKAQSARKTKRAKKAEVDAKESGLNDIRRGYRLEKAIYSNKTRLLIVAGLEGVYCFSFPRTVFITILSCNIKYFDACIYVDVKIARCY